MPPRKPKPTNPPKPTPAPAPEPIPVPDPTPAPIPPVPSGSRNAALHPFASDSPWNMPLGSGVQFAPSSDLRLADLLAPWVAINAASWSQNVYIATAADPTRHVVNSNGQGFDFAIPDAAVPSPDADAHLLIISPDHHTVHEMAGARRQSDGSMYAWYYVRTDLYGSGVEHGGIRAYGGSALGGLIRTWELQQGAIQHALAFAVPHGYMRPGPVWPANSEDAQNGDYTGHNPMGTLAAIPQSVDLSTLGLSVSGLLVARALQSYGAYLVDTSGFAKSGNFALYAEPSSDALLTGARADLGRIRSQLRIVTNNSPTSVGGGGTPLVPLAPALA